MNKLGCMQVNTKSAQTVTLLYKETKIVDIVQKQLKLLIYLSLMLL